MSYAQRNHRLTKFNNEIWIALELKEDTVYLKDFIIALSTCGNDDVVYKTIDYYRGDPALIIYVIFYGSLNLLQQVMNINTFFTHKVTEFIEAACCRDDDNPEILAYILEKTNADINGFCWFIFYSLSIYDNANITKFALGKINMDIHFSMLEQNIHSYITNASYKSWRIFLDRGLILKMSSKNIVPYLMKIHKHLKKDKYIEFAKVTMEAYHSRLIFGIEEVIKDWPSEITEM
jgi:hypothetical protein